MRTRAAVVARASLLISVIAACTADSGRGPEDDAGAVPDASLRSDAAIAADAGEPHPLDAGRDAALDAGRDEALDGALDAGRDASVTLDAGLDAAADASLPPSYPGTTVAIPGTYCPVNERVGLIRASRPAAVDVYGTVYDRPDPWYSEPELTSAACHFHRFVQDFCPVCADDEICGREDDGCVAVPRRRKDVQLELRAGNETQTFVADPQTGEFYGEVTLGRPWSAVLTIGDHTITLVEMALPDGLTGLRATLHGTWDAPQGIDVAWDNGFEQEFVYTLIPINHHAGGPTFTECRVPASTPGFHVDEDMLAPLAVRTGLEFQSIEHIRTAAAVTPFGCIEFRYTYPPYQGLL